MFKGRRLLVVTKHGKDKVIAPILEKELGVKCMISENFDTDMFGTFTGDIQRKDEPRITVRNKCLLAMKSMNYDLAIASEGSFGPHPFLFFAPINEEFLIFIDIKNNLEIIIRELSIETNFNGREIKTEEELYDFAEKAKFPSHRLIIRKAKDDFSEVIKGIGNKYQLRTIFSHFLNNYGSAFIETDMRAMYNPTRLKVIERATQKLAEKIRARCPDCGTPGFGISEARRGLPCQICNYPTKGVLSYIYSCLKCSFTKEEKYPDGKDTEDPMWCDLCNP